MLQPNSAHQEENFEVSYVIFRQKIKKLQDEHNFIINYLCDDFDHLQLINLCDTKIPTDDCFFNKKRS